MVIVAGNLGEGTVSSILGRSESYIDNALEAVTLLQALLLTPGELI